MIYARIAYDRPVRYTSSALKIMSCIKLPNPDTVRTVNGVAVKMKSLGLTLRVVRDPHVLSPAGEWVLAILIMLRQLKLCAMVLWVQWGKRLLFVRIVNGLLRHISSRSKPV